MPKNFDLAEELKTKIAAQQKHLKAKGYTEAQIEFAVKPLKKMLADISNTKKAGGKR